MSTSETVPDDTEFADHGALSRVDVGDGVALVGLAVFWAWLLARWVNDLTGGLLVPPGQPFVPPATIESFGAGLPVLAGLFDAVAFAFTNLPTLANALRLTLILTLIGTTAGFVLAVPLSVARVYGKWSAWVALAYTELLRGTPLLAQLFVFYYGLNLGQYVPDPLVALFAAGPAVWVAIVGFTLNSSAYQAEYIRAAIESVDAGQLTAGRAIGLSKLESVRFVVLPQALRFAIPGWSNELVYMIKYSSLAAFITVPELFNRVNAIASENFRYTAMFSLAALLYLALVISASRLMGWVEEETSIPGLGTSGDP
ncbi:MAG: amino acid ABC transporter permease [Haloferacaceae archaeon]